LFFLLNGYPGIAAPELPISPAAIEI